MKLMTHFVKKKVEEMAKEMPKRPHNFRSLKEAHDILIFYNAKNQQDIEPCLETLRMLRKNVKACVYVSQEFSVENKENYLCLEKKEHFNSFGFPRPETKERSARMNADILIDLTENNCYSMKYLVLKHPSAFKIGLKWDKNQSLHDFSLMVTDCKDMKYLFGQIIFYLQTIRSKGVEL